MNCVRVFWVTDTQIIILKPILTFNAPFQLQKQNLAAIGYLNLRYQIVCSIDSISREIYGQENRKGVG